ncbi:MAG TPA: M14 family zinc carboxypeptidase, partial [Longimicrobiales bacterium]|nr:M14 family zinc carboxypeptidase [Longimicrobiales bacterium]
MGAKPLLPLVVLALLALAASGLRAQDAAPSPSEFHGYPLGSRYTITSALYDYYRALAQASPRVEYREYGTSIQGRPLPMLLVGTQEYLAREEEIRRATRRIGGAEGPLPEAALDELIRRTPAVVWIFIVDTDEEAGVEALQEVAHDLATREDEAARLVRSRVLTIFTPLTNPDSHARYVTWHKIYNVDGAATDPLAVENEAHWAMNTDGNAWGVDVNRDFGFFVTPEMAALGRRVTAWRPQFFLDVHSGPDVLFIPPFPRPFHPLWPDAAPRWWNAVAERANRAFGERGWSFSTRKDYEGVAGVGFGLSWGMLGPAGVSFLFENFGGRPGKTTAFVRSDGSV